MHTQILLLIGVAGLMFLIIGGLAFISHYYTLNGIKSKTVGDGQHGTARWATKQEIRQTYAHIPFEPELWRQGKNLPDQQGLILGCEGPKGHVTAVVDTDDIHALVTAASGAGKTAFFLYPNIEYALATGMSFLCTDTKGDLFRNYLEDGPEWLDEVPAELFGELIERIIIISPERLKFRLLNGMELAENIERTVR